MKYFFLAVSCLICQMVLAQKEALPFAKTITPHLLKQHLEIIASPKMEGRATASAGQQRAAEYIEKQFQTIGLQPGNGQSYQQPFPVYQDDSIHAALSVNGRQFKWTSDFSLLSTSTAAQLNFAEAIFVGYGLVDSNSQTNDYQNLSVKDKLVVVLSGTPSNCPLPTSQTSISAKINNAKAKGASAICIVVSNLSTVKNALITKRLYFQPPANTIANICISTQVASAIMGLPSNTDMATLGKLTAGTSLAKINLQIHRNTQQLTSTNVVGVLEGTDKKAEYVVLTAHYDHLGVRNGKIYCGADDDGSGTTAVLAMAKAFAAAKKEGKAPRRTIVFMTVSGEENGLWGSQYYSENPLFPLENTSANLNTDMVGRVGSDFKGDTSNYLYVIGDDKLSTDLASITDSVNQQFQLILDRKYNDLNDPNRFYFRSDHYNFARKGVPVIFYFNGVHADYHQPSDTVDKINFPLMQKRVQFIFCTAWCIANSNHLLKRNLTLQIPAR